MYNRGIACCLGVVLAAVVFAGCGAGQKQKDVYGNNKLIVQSGDSLTYKDRKGKVTAQDAGLTFTGFYGSDTLWSVEATEKGTLSIKFEQDITKGKFKVVLITPEEEMVLIAEGSAEGSVELPLIQGNSRIKIVGNKSKGNVNLHLTAGKGIEIDTVEGGW